MSQKLFALWEASGCIIDSPTTMLGSAIARFEEDGVIVAVGYGGSRFRPRIVLPFVTGQRALTEFEKLVNDRRVAHNAFKGMWGDKYEELKKKYRIP